MRIPSFPSTTPAKRGLCYFDFRCRPQVRITQSGLSFADLLATYCIGLYRRYNEGMTQDYPIISPASTLPNGIASDSALPNGTLVYNWDDLKVQMNDTKDGCQATFFRNGAAACDPTQFGIKIYSDYWDARCAYARQKVAAASMLAPPVGKFLVVRNKKNKTIYWGYQTSVAIVIDEDTPTHSRLFPDDDSMWNGPVRLRRLLRNVSVGGLPCNDLTIKGRQCPTPLRGRKKWCLGGDLHSWNVMWWNDGNGGYPVCIDFGYHSVLSGNRGRLIQVYDVNIA